MSARDRTIGLIGALALVMLVLVFVGYATLSGRSIESVLPTVLGFATPVIVTLLAATGARVEMGKMQAKVNGNYDELAARNEELAAALAQVSERFTATTGQMPAVTVAEIAGRHRRGNADG